MKISFSTISKILLETLPLFLFLLFLLFSNDFILFSNTILGNSIALLLIIFYFSQDILYGLLFFLIVLCYYQTDIVHKICKSENFIPMNPVNYESFTMVTDDSLLLNKNVFPTDTLPQRNLTSVNSNDTIEILPETTKVFKKNHCSPSLEFVYKENILHHPETIRNIYPEIEFVEKQCNPCDPNCRFSLTSLEENNQNLDRIGKSTKKNTPDMFTQLMNWADSFTVNKSEPFIGIGGGYNASYYNK
jgi:hypothetical protein